MSDFDKVPALLDNLLSGSMAEAARRVGIHPSTPWRWLVQSKLGKPELQEIEFCGVLAPFHTHYAVNVPALTAMQIQQTALERARDGVQTDVFFQGVRMFEKRLKPEYEGMNEETLWLDVGPDWEKECYETIPTKQWLKPSDALVIKMLESYNRKRYGAHQTVDVNYGGVLRLEPNQTNKPAAIEQATDVFEDAPDDPTEQKGGHLALAAPAKSSEDFEERAASGEFDPAVVTFRDANGQPAALRPDIEELRRAAAELKQHGPVHAKPEGKVTIYKPDESDKAVIAEDQEPEPQTLTDHPRAYQVDKLTPYKAPVARYSKPERDIGSGREGVGVGPDPRKVGPHVGFPVSRG